MVQAQSELHSSFAAQLANYHRLQCWYAGDQSLLVFQDNFLDFSLNHTAVAVRKQIISLYAEKYVSDADDAVTKMQYKNVQLLCSE